MVAWVRYAPGSQAEDKVAKLDIDLCDERGNVCVQMRGLSSRVLEKENVTHAAQGKTIGSLLAIPVWQADGVEVPANATKTACTEHNIILCELSEIDVEKLVSLLPDSQFLSLPAWEEKNIAERYSECALACFKRIQTVLQGKPQGKVLFQIVVGGGREQAVLAGLWGLLKTATLENPQLIGQLLLVPAEVTTEELSGQLQAEMQQPLDRLVRYEQGVRQVLRWEEVSAQPEKAPIAFQDQGVYLITGGLGGLGLVFAKEILAQSREARVVLTGRSALDAEKQSLLDKLSAPVGRVSYRQVDLGNLDQVKQLIVAIQDAHGQMKGILHSAGMIADNFILKKDRAEFSKVLAPKVMGTYNLDQATQHAELDFFVLFSSIAGAMGNVGQADYAAANGFMDQFAAYRNGQVAAKQRYGGTRSINWGAWQAGGMGTDAANWEMLQEATGMQAMQTATGVEAFYRSLVLPCDQMLIAEGDLPRMRRALTASPAVPSTPAEPQAKHPVVAAEIDSESLVEKTQDYLRKQLAELLQLPSHKIDPQAALENYGIDSILAMKLTNKLEKTFGSLSKTLFFEYQTIAGLAGYFLKAYPAIVREQIGIQHEASRAKQVDQTAIEKRQPTPAIRSKNRFAGFKTAGFKTNDRREIAIVGLAGRYPQAENLQEFWKNLQNGRDCITEIPPERWDHELYYDPDRNKLGKSYSKWGGFIADVDKFDPLFFNISPKEAALTDPQERLFLETAWETIEDAGYTKESISGSRVGVFVGVMWGQYELFGAEAILSGDAAIPNSSYASIANRVSYFFDFHGPSMALDTMCSSSLTAIDLACKELRAGEIDAAIAGGVNVTVHPSKYLSMSQGKFAASDGKCRSFGQGGDGYVPGEGVGAVLLKPLENALRDGDQIYAVIKSSALNHGGKTNGYTVPNPNAQGDLVLDALKKANIDPKTMSYIETHGTGTSLGDPIEITGLLKAFEGSTEEKQFCPIGSVKSNIGHLESAAGIAAVTKALLQIKYKQLVPSLHADPPNPNINFQESPFYVQTELVEWKHTAAHPRRVGVSSFGAGGSNAHLILEEYAGAREPESASHTTPLEAFVLSARDQDALCRYAERVVHFLENAPDVSLANMAYTSQVGRSPMDARLVIITSSVKDLKDKLNQWITLRKNKNIRAEGGAPELEDVFHGSVREAQYAGNLIEGRAGKAFLADLLANKDLEKLARFWILGVEIDWALLHRDATPKRVSLPTYPFAKERCWVEINQKTPAPRAVQKKALDTRKVVVSGPAEDKKRTYYYPQWTLQSVVASVEKKPAIGPILVFDSSEELFLTMKGLRENGPADNGIVLVKPGKSFQEIGPNIYTIDTEREEQFHELMENLRSKNLLPGVVLHHCSDVCNLEVKQQVNQHLNNGVYALFYLCKALMKEKPQVPLKFVSVFSSHSEATAPLGAAIGGFFKTLVLENPRYLAKVVDIQSGPGRDGEMSLSEKAGLIWDEIYEKDWTAQEIRYRNSMHEDKQTRERCISELVPQTPIEKKSAVLPLRQKGVYLITGGLGGIGLIFAEYLAKNFQAKLVLVGRSAPSARQEEKLSQLKGYGAEILVLQANVSKFEDMERIVREAKARFSQINGVIHAAGMNRDSFIVKKTREEMEAVLAAKVYGTINLDLATRNENLDLFVLFSSIAGVMGNLGQSDYAYANHFLDSFVESREKLKRTQKRSGRTLSINWPLWEEGGMNVSPDHIALAEKQTGICPLPTKDGIRYWEDFLRSEALQGVALYGIPSRIAASIAQKPVKRDKNVTALADGVDAAMLLAKTEEYLKALVGEEIKLAPDRIGSSDRLESFGIDSVMINQLNIHLEKDLGPLPKTLLYEHETVQELAQFLLQEAREALVVRFGLAHSPGEPSISSAGIEEETVQDETPAAEAEIKDDLGAIAIIGIHGYYPHSANLAEYWENLKQGRDLIDLVPPSRWDYEEFYHPDPVAASDGKIYCKWGGFLDDYDKFDPHFFNISIEEAKVIDPQERLFLESVWAAIEDAGYTRESLKKRAPKGRSADVGVFVGVTTNSYHLWAPEERSRGNIVFPSALPWSIANRVSYFFDFSGPSMPVDTACSSSLVAVHLACESLKRSECQVAIAGGVNLYLHPSKYQSLCQRRMLSLDGKCHSYGAGDDGFVPGEAVGTLVLKPLSKAIEHQDHIYAVIPASAFDHSGRSNGYSAPNPNSQSRLISQTLKKAHIHPETIGYVEGHGTGTQLGDGIEIVALTQAFRKQTTKKQFCPIGSVKANIGHSESAAGIGSLTKVILQMKHRQLAPTIYSDEANANIEFKDSPFYLQHGLSEWESSPDQPRRALINSFGAGGVNACVVLEEYQQPGSPENRREAGPYLFALSAKDEDRLREYANRMLIQLRSEQEIDLGDLCYTLQVGREAMEERLATVVSEVGELIDRLDEWSKRGPSSDIYHGNVGPRRKRSKVAKTAGQGLTEIASMWVTGEEVSWDTLYPWTKPRRIALPTYPFARGRYWISNSLAPEKRTPPNAQLHPLISYNSSTLKEVSFGSSLSDTAFYAVDHKVNEEGIFPGAGYLEMACISGNIAAERRVRKIKDIVWVRPLSFRKGPQAVRTLLKSVGDTVEYVISSFDDENEEVLHSEGKLAFRSGWADPVDAGDQIPIEALKAQCARPEDVTAYYNKFRKYGVHYGPSFQTIQEIYINGSFALSKLKVADHLKSDFGQFILHPSIIDGALQTAAALVGGLESATPHLPFALDEVDILHPVRQTCYAYAEFADSRERTHAGVRKFNIRLLNESGDVLISFRNLFVRALPTIQAAPRSAETARLSVAAGA
ncbi:MAG: SDR family NAD(P)-dependent oxidoreductase [Acidobacteriia bacterium]|nr:SDR family NAD(P)-dependent oxidoreductase [Terriglobia bacterium]